ncbi:hypothetical protein LCGC14_1774920 [marine sediment metagenome]|uniref:Disease resistance R13L4/SHOC-2-like LRR domain-containing protein n=1 Tax=marine sediment metagenome TaxID=412755 RepID=A0A0F9GXA0_9ZZZZ
MEFQVNRFITLKLENRKTTIYIDGKPFILCKCLFIDIPIDKVNSNTDINSIDELPKKHDLPFRYHLTPETEFWAHSSNLQVFAENNYNTSLLHSNIAFPILYRLTELGDRKARKIYKDEIGKRFSSGHLPVIKFLWEESYLGDLNDEEKDTIYDNLILNLSAKKKIEQTLSVLDYLVDLNFPKAEKDIKKLIQEGLKKGDKAFSKLLFRYEYIHYLNKLELYDCLDSRDILIKIGHYTRDKLELHEEFDSGEKPGFNIEGNQVTGLDLWGSSLETIPEEILELKFLKDLKLTQNRLQSLPEDLKNLEFLKNLYLKYNNLRALPDSFGYIPSLEIVDLDRNFLSTLPDSIGNLKNLKKLSLVSNELISLPNSIGNLKSLISLNLCSNELTSLPKTFEGLENLQELHLDVNKFSVFPEVITRLKSLKKLNIEHNYMSTLPASIGTLKSLIELNLSNNKFKSLPESIGNLKSLKTLIINHSNLESLPESIGNLKSLEVFYLSQHDIKNFPESLNNLRSLKEINLRTLKRDNPKEILRMLTEKGIKVYN